jgi:hypothetical protein
MWLPPGLMEDTEKKDTYTENGVEMTTYATINTGIVIVDRLSSRRHRDEDDDDGTDDTRTSVTIDPVSLALKTRVCCMLPTPLTKTYGELKNFPYCYQSILHIFTN